METETAVPRQLPKLVQDRHGARRKWDPMRPSHLHPPGRDFPDRVVKVELAHWPRAARRAGRTSGRAIPARRASRARPDSPQLPAATRQGFRRDDGRTGLDRWGDERSAQRPGWIVFRARRRDRVAKNVAYRRSQLEGSFVSAARLDPLEDIKTSRAVISPIGRYPSVEARSS